MGIAVWRRPGPRSCVAPAGPAAKEEGLRTYTRQGAVRPARAAVRAAPSGGSYPGTAHQGPAAADTGATAFSPASSIVHGRLVARCILLCPAGEGLALGGGQCGYVRSQTWQPTGPGPGSHAGPQGGPSPRQLLTLGSGRARRGRARCCVAMHPCRLRRATAARRRPRRLSLSRQSQSGGGLRGTVPRRLPSGRESPHRRGSARSGGGAAVNRVSASAAAHAQRPGRCRPVSVPTAPAEPRNHARSQRRGPPADRLASKAWLARQA